MFSLKKKLPSKTTTGPFYGKPIATELAIEVTHQMKDCYDALKCNKPLPLKPEGDISFLFRCNQIARHYHSYINLQLQGLTYKRSYLTDDEVVYVYLLMHKGDLKKPLITLGNHQINISKK